MEELAECVHCSTIQYSMLTCSRNIDRLPATLDHALKNIHDLTGWVGYAVFAGPHPRTGATTSILYVVYSVVGHTCTLTGSSTSVGKSLLTGNKFIVTYEEEAQEFVKLFTEFAHLCFCEYVTCVRVNVG